MALVFIPQYTLTFDTTSGQDINYEVDILRSYDDTVHSTVPSDFFTTAVPLIGDSDPVIVRYERDYEIYKPIQGSSADLNLVINSDTLGTEGSIQDLASGSPYEWQLRVRYRDGNNDLQPYWCGFFNPVDTTETVNTFPFSISYTAVDGLGLLEQATPTRPTIDQPISIFSDVILPALRQTGLELDVYVQSGILNNGAEALTTATASSFSVYKDLEGNGELFTYKEILEGWLAAFNCHITQANGRWYIYNASTLGDSVTWSTWNPQGTVSSTAMESLVLTIDGTSSQDLVPSNQDLQLSLRRPNGSVECRPQDLVERQFAENGNFSSGTDGWTINSNTQTTVGQSTLPGAGTDDNSIRIVRNYFSLSSLFDNFAFRNTTGYQIDRLADIEVSFDAAATRIFEDGVRLYWTAYATFDNEPIEQLTPPTNYNSSDYQNQYNSLYRTWTYSSTSNIERLYWHARREEWSTTPNNLLTHDFNEVNEISNVSQTFRNPTTFFNEFQRANLSNLRFFVQFYTLRLSLIHI